MSCFFNFWKLSSLMTCSIRQASLAAVSGETLAATINEEAVTLEDVYEPYLMQM